ncbi:hypothetical protein BJ741DRAFT_589870 [Chytriomyces cf. hyalinus JEL632]|nr:hypothetical protein BJ741DRAFT_589870 [Chytriomyces cf. hyalinus JEL632]
MFSASLPSIDISRFIWITPFCQLAICAALVIHRFITTPIAVYDFYDSTWCCIIQLIMSAAVLRYILKRVKSQTFRASAMLLGLGVTFVLGLFAAFSFLLAYNYRVINCDAAPSTLDSGDYSTASVCARNMNVIIRNGIFWVAQVFSIHPIISYILELWSLELWFADTSDFTVETL